MSPEPFVRGDLDLRDFRWMKLDLIALFNSDFNSTADDTAWRAGVTLWGKAWHQVPAGSLPDDEGRLCNLSGLGRDVKTFRRVRGAALHGFVLCSDGRLYHRFLCGMAAEAAAERDRYSKRKETDRARKIQRNSSGIPSECEVVSSGIPSEILPDAPPDPAEFHRKKLLEGQGEGDKEPPIPPTAEKRPKPSEVDFEFSEFWKAYPRREDKGHALKAYRAARRQTSAETLAIAARRFAEQRRGKDAQYTPLAATWLTGERWLDEDVAPAVPASSEAGQWRQRLKGYRERGIWLAWGPKPDEPRCAAPAELLIEFGYRQPETVT